MWEPRPKKQHRDASRILRLIAPLAFGSRRCGCVGRNLARAAAGRRASPLDTCARRRAGARTLTVAKETLDEA